MVVLTPVSTWPQSAPPSELKASFLINFARLSDWPNPPAGAPLTLCVLGDDRVADALSNGVRGQRIGSRPLTMSKVTADSPIGACQLLFVGGQELRASAPLLDAIRLQPILTVSDGAGFSQSTGMIELFVDAGRMQFAINLEAVKRAGVRLSSRLLGLSKAAPGPRP